MTTFRALHAGRVIRPGRCLAIAVLAAAACAPAQTTPPASATTTAPQAATSTPESSPTQRASPTATATASSTPSATASPRPAAASAEELVDALQSALRDSDYTRLRELITRSGWTASFYRSESLPYQNRAQVIDSLRRSWSDARLRIRVETRPLHPTTPLMPAGDRFAHSTWSEYSGQAEHHVLLVVRNEGGTWYWSGALFNMPGATVTPEPYAAPPCDASGDFAPSTGVSTPIETLTVRQASAREGVGVDHLSPVAVALNFVEQLGMMSGWESSVLEWPEPLSSRITLCYRDGSKLKVHLYRPFPSEDEPIWAVREYQRSR
jgi:hypothetical protein